jgi:hypothetical protein
MAGIVGDYKVLARTSRTLAVGQDIDQTFRFELPAATVRDQDAVLTFSLLRSENLRLRITVNDEEAFDRRHGSGDVRCVQAVVGSVVKPGQNEITFRVVTGELLFADVVLWFQRNAEFSTKVTGGLF